MRDYMNIGSSPPEEDCVCLGEEDYSRRARIECRQYIEALRKKLGEEPEGASLGIKSFPHDFGTYMEVVCYFDTDNKESLDYACKCEGDGPMTWAEVGMKRPDFNDNVKKSEDS